MNNAPTSKIPTNADAALVQAKMNIRILSLKHAMKLEGLRVIAASKSMEETKAPNAVDITAQAGIIEEYLLAGILTPATPATVQTEH